MGACCNKERQDNLNFKTSLSFRDIDVQRKAKTISKKEKGTIHEKNLNTMGKQIKSFDSHIGLSKANTKSHQINHADDNQCKKEHDKVIGSSSNAVPCATQHNSVEFAEMGIKKSGSEKSLKNTMVQSIKSFNTHQSIMNSPKQKSYSKIKEEINNKKEEEKAKPIVVLQPAAKATTTIEPINMKPSITSYRKLSSIQVEISADIFRCENTGHWEDKYEIVCFIDRGGFGEISKIRDKTTGAIRALKTMSKIKCQMTDNFADEIIILKKLVYFLSINISFRIIYML